MTALTIGSLFAGVGGIEIGLERAGLGPVLWQAEQDPYCQRVLAKHWPEAKRYDDVRYIDGETERVDLICGGFPCQNISNAGKREGMAGEQSGLWREYARIIRVLRPRFVVVENVSALLARGFGDVLGDLAACGYDAQWDCIPAAAVGAPHRRDRLFVIAYANGDGLRTQQEQQEQQFGSGVPSKSHAHGPSRPLANANSARQLQQSGPVCVVGGRASDRGGEARSQWAVEPDLGRVAHGVSARAHRLRALGNAVVPQVAEVIGRVIVGMA